MCNLYRPGAQGSGKGLAERVLGRGQVAPLPSQPRHQPALALAGDALRRFCGVGHAHCAGGDGSTGLTSTLPAEAQGARAAHSSASSSDATSTMT